MATDNTNFIPQIWSARLLANLDKALVYGDCVNRDYEGEIRNYGDTVRINQIGSITVDDYDPTDGGVGTPEDLTSAQTTLVIDQKKYFNFKVEDIDAAQANVNLVDEAMKRAAYAMSDVIDRHIAGLYVNVHSTNVIGSDTTPFEVDALNIYDTLVDLATILDENDVPRVDRFVVLPPWMLNMLAKDVRFTNNPTVLANGIVDGQQIAGMQVRMSNNVPNTNGTKYKIIAGSKMAISFAGQITKIETYRPESLFADAVKGLYCYGAKVVLPKAIAVLCLLHNKNGQSCKRNSPLLQQ